MFHLLERVISGINTITDSYYTENFPGPSPLLSNTVSTHIYLQVFKRDRKTMIQYHTTQIFLINSPKYLRYLHIRQEDKKSNSLPDTTKRTEKCTKCSNNTLPCFTSLLFQPILTGSVKKVYTLYEHLTKKIILVHIKHLTQYRITQFHLFIIDFYLKNFFIQNSGSKDSDAVGVHNCFVTSVKWFCSFFVTVNNHCNTLFLHTDSYSMPPIKKTQNNLTVIYVFKTRSSCSYQISL